MKICIWIFINVNRVIFTDFNFIKDDSKNKAYGGKDGCD